MTVSALPEQVEPELQVGSVEAELEAILPPAYRAWPSVKCDYIKRNGEQCKQWALRGATKCLSHGAQLPQARQAAERRVMAARILLMESSGKVSKRLIKIARGEIDANAVQVTAAKAVLDRAGLTPIQRVQSDVTVHVRPDAVDEDIERLLSRGDEAIEAEGVELPQTDDMREDG